MDLIYSTVSSTDSINFRGTSCLPWFLRCPLSYVGPEQDNTIIGVNIFSVSHRNEGSKCGSGKQSPLLFWSCTSQSLWNFNFPMNEIREHIKLWERVIKVFESQIFLRSHSGYSYFDKIFSKTAYTQTQVHIPQSLKYCAAKQRPLKDVHILSSWMILSQCNQEGLYKRV